MCARIQTAEPLVPRNAGLAELRKAAARCKACDLWKLGTQTVFGEGSEHARVMLVGEQPGDKEDRQGRPFVSPAGAVLDKALAAAGLERHDDYRPPPFENLNREPRRRRRTHQN